MKVLKRDIGKWCTIRYDDMGIVTGLILEAETDDRWIKVFRLADDMIDRVDRDQIVTIGKRVCVPANAV